MTSVDTELALVALGAMLSPTTLFLSVLALVVGERPMRTGLWFYLGALGVTLIIGVIAAFVLGNAAASPKPNTPKTWVAVIDVLASVMVLFAVVRFSCIGEYSAVPAVNSGENATDEPGEYHDAKRHCARAR